MSEHGVVLLAVEDREKHSPEGMHPSTHCESLTCTSASHDLLGEQTTQPIVDDVFIDADVSEIGTDQVW